MSLFSKLVIGASALALTAVIVGVAFMAASCRTTPSGKAFAADGTERDPSQILAVGDVAPDFEAKDQNGQIVRLADFRGKKSVVLIFYPMNETPGCTAQLCAARDAFDQYQKADAVVMGVNPADAASHKKFAEAQNYQFPLLADTEGTIVRNYGTRGLAGFVNRTVYVVGKDGRIVFAQRGMPATKDILAAIEAANKG